MRDRSLFGYPESVVMGKIDLTKCQMLLTDFYFSIVYFLSLCQICGIYPHFPLSNKRQKVKHVAKRWSPARASSKSGVLVHTHTYTYI